MGPPPKYLIQRKLITKFMAEEVVPNKPLIPPYYFTRVFECWKKFGPSNPKCKQDEIMYDFANQEVKSYKKSINGLNLKQMVASKLKKPNYPVNNKGRHKKDMFTTVLKYL